MAAVLARPVSGGGRDVRDCPPGWRGTGLIEGRDGFDRKDAAYLNSGQHGLGHSLEEAREELKLRHVEQRRVAHSGELAVLGVQLREVDVAQPARRFELQEDALRVAVGGG